MQISLQRGLLLGKGGVPLLCPPQEPYVPLHHCACHGIIICPFLVSSPASLEVPEGQGPSLRHPGGCGAAWGPDWVRVI